MSPLVSYYFRLPISSFVSPRRFEYDGFHPVLRGKRFFPLPKGYFNKNNNQKKKVEFTKPREVRSAGMAEAEDELASVPWEMRYFSPMLRG